MTVKGRMLLLFIIILCFIAIGCNKNKDVMQSSMNERMVLIYIAANNDLQSEAINSIKKMQLGASSLNGVLVVFVKSEANHSYLLKIRHNTRDDRIISDTIKVYGNENACDPNFLKRVVADSRQLYSAHSYGLVMWSHATSWAPPSNVIKIKSFGYDNEYEMDIKDLKQVLPDDFEYIMFDACSMASMEVCYELKDNAKYILASPAEILSMSFPYDQITPHLFEGIEGLKLTAHQFIQYYTSLSGMYSSATISLIDTKKLDVLATCAKALLANDSLKLPVRDDNIQSLDFQRGGGVPAYDFVDFFEKNYTVEQCKNIIDALQEAVIYKGHTDKFLEISINTFCGLSVYLPTLNDPLKDYYASFKWYDASGWNKLFNN